MYQIIYLPKFAKDLAKLPLYVQKQIVKAVSDLREDPFSLHVKKLEGVSSIYRLRVGDYRVVFQIDKQRGSILLTRAAHRKDIYH